MLIVTYGLIVLLLPILFALTTPTEEPVNVKEETDLPSYLKFWVCSGLILAGFLLNLYVEHSDNKFSGFQPDLKGWFRHHKALLAAIACISVIATVLIVGCYLNQMGFEFTAI